MNQRQEILIEKNKTEIISQNRLSEIELLTYQNGKIMLRLALAYSEIERITKKLSLKKN